MGEARAAVDCGTNSTRLIVVDGDGQRRVREMTITRLGYGVDETGMLDDEALQRTLDTIARYRRVWDEHGVSSDRVRIAATSAVRDAADRDRFFDGVREVAGVDAEVLSGTEEAATAFLGATRAVDVATPPALLDVGGGSTELIVGDAAGEVAGSFSMQLGCVRLSERLLRSDPPTAPEVQAATDEIGARLDEADAALAAQGVGVRDAAALIAVAGTSTTLAALHLGLDEYVEERIHATVVSRAAVREWADRLVRLPARERATLGPMQPGREDVIAAGALIVAAVLERYGFEEMTVSEADILDGLAMTAG